MADNILKIVALATLVSAIRNTYGLPLKAHITRSIGPHTFGSSSHGFSSAGIGGLVSSDKGGFGGFSDFGSWESLGEGAVVSSGFGGLESLKFGPCPKGLERTINGKCVPPAVSQDLFLFKAPSYKVHNQKAFFEHKPKVHLNLVFIRAPTYEAHQSKPIVVPPPKQQTLVYLLSKKPHGFKQDIIEVPLDPSKPEVFFVDYKDGDNPVLPGGIDLRTALSQAAGPSDILVGPGDGIGGGFVDGASLGGFAFGGLGKGVAGTGLTGVALGGFGKGVSEDLAIGSFQGGFGGGSLKGGIVGGSVKGGIGGASLAGGLGAGSFKGGFGGVAVGGGLGKEAAVSGAVAPAVGGGFGLGLTGLALKAAEAAGPPVGFAGGVGGISGAGKEIESNIFESVAAGHDPFGDHEEIIIDHGVKGLKAGGVSFGDGKGSPISAFGGFGVPFRGGGFGGERSVRSEVRPRGSGNKGNIVSGSPLRGF